MKYLLSLIIIGFALLNCNSKDANSPRVQTSKEEQVELKVATSQAVTESENLYDQGAVIESEETKTIEQSETKIEEEVVSEKKTIDPHNKQAVKTEIATVETKTNTANSSVAVPEPEPIEETIQDVKTKTPAETAPLSFEKPTEPVEETIHDVKTETSTPAPLVKLHDPFNDLLQKYVSASGKINYKGIKAEVNQLDAYLETLGNTKLSGLNKKEKLAFWINAYNAFTIKKIVNNYPVGKITDLDGGKPWDVKWIKLDGKTVSLNNIENDIIRPTFKEPRIHFAVNCAAKSCPPLWNKAWTAANMEAAFESQARNFINNSSYNKISENTVEISKIFEWYGSDFGDLIAYLNKYSEVKISDSAKVSYKAYDWNLNN